MLSIKSLDIFAFFFSLHVMHLSDGIHKVNQQKLCKPCGCCVTDQNLTFVLIPMPKFF